MIVLGIDPGTARTGYGIVRVYRFAGAHDDLPPLLLLPGRAAPTPVWADNLPGLLALRSVYAIDLIGEPGLSVQDRPIENDADQAAWLHEVIAQPVNPEGQRPQDVEQLLDLLGPGDGRREL